MRWSSRLSRRQLLKAGTMAGAGMLVPWRFGGWTAAGSEPSFLDPDTLTRFIDPLPIPPTWSTAQLEAEGLTMASAMHRFSAQMNPTPTWGYGGATYLGPTLEAQSGTPVTFLARNRLGGHPLGIDAELHGALVEDADHPRVSLHLHGGYTEPESDGYPEDTFLPGEDHPYTYAEDQQAGTVWYHDHALGITRLNVYAGLAGFHLIRDAEAEADLPAGEFELPIAIQDKRFLVDDSNATNPLFYPSPWEPEFFGDVAVVNGAVWPTREVRRGWYRLRLLNGSSSRIYHLSLSPRQPMLLVGTDTGFVGRPQSLDRLILAPGERADVLVDFGRYPPDSVVRLVNLPLPAHVVSPEDMTIDELVEFRVSRQLGLRGSPLRRPRPFTPLDARQVVRRRTLLLTEIMDPATDEPVMALLNARRWETDDIERPLVDTLEQWDLVNLTADTHPIHLHLVQFQPLDRQPIDAARYLEHVFGAPMLTPAHVGTGAYPFPAVDDYLAGRSRSPDAWERGWKDTVQAHPGMVTRILVPFGPSAAAGVPFGNRVEQPFTGRYVWHCHILDHEDHEMMLPYEVMA